MVLVNPSLEYLKQDDMIGNNHVAQCAAVCYKTEKFNTAKMVERLVRDGHISMFRHASHYYRIPKLSEIGIRLGRYLDDCKLFGNNPFIPYAQDKDNYFIVLNGQYIIEHPKFESDIMEYQIPENEFSEYAPNLVRFTFVITCSIKVSRELNRVSPNNIAEQSTRYVNFLNKYGDVTVCKSVDSHLSDDNKKLIYDYLKKETDIYSHLIENKIAPEDARRVLPLDTATRCAYTYTLNEWKHILDLRYYEKTGKAAPDAKVIGELIHDKLLELGYLYE